MEILSANGTNLLDDLAQLLPQLEVCDDVEMRVIHDECRTKVKLIRVGASIELHSFPDIQRPGMQLMERVILCLGDFEGDLYVATQWGGTKLDRFRRPQEIERILKWTEIIRAKLAEQITDLASASELRG